LKGLDTEGTNSRTPSATLAGNLAAVHRRRYSRHLRHLGTNVLNSLFIIVDFSAKLTTPASFFGLL
jgi:hypothetical protein